MSDTQTTETTDAGQITGAMDKDYNLLWYTETCLEHALRLETYCKDAERAGDDELVELFRKAQADSRKGAQMGMRMLADRLTGMAPPASAATSAQGDEMASGEKPARGSGDMASSGPSSSQSGSSQM